MFFYIFIEVRNICGPNDTIFWKLYKALVQPEIPAGGVSLESIERQLVTRALNQARFNKTRAARLLGLTRAQLYSRIEKYGLADPTPE